MRAIIGVAVAISMLAVINSCVTTKEEIKPVEEPLVLTDGDRLEAFVEEASDYAAEDISKKIIDASGIYFDSPSMFMTNHPNVSGLVAAKYESYDSESKTEEELYKSIEGLSDLFKSGLLPKKESDQKSLEVLVQEYEQSALNRFRKVFSDRFKEQYGQIFTKPENTEQRIEKICDSFYETYQKKCCELLVAYFRDSSCSGMEEMLAKTFKAREIDPDEELMEGMTKVLCRSYSNALMAQVDSLLVRASDEIKARELKKLKIEICVEITANVTTETSERLIERIGNVPIDQLTEQEVDVIQKTPRFSGITDDDLKSLGLQKIDLGDVLQPVNQSGKSLILIDGNLLSYYDSEDSHADDDSKLFQQALAKNILANFPSVKLLERDGITLNNLYPEALAKYLIGVGIRALRPEVLRTAGNVPFRDYTRVPYANNDLLQNQVKWSASDYILVYWPLEFKVLKESLGYKDSIPYRKRRALVRAYLQLIDPADGLIIYSGIKTPEGEISDETPAIWDYLAEGRGYAPLRDLNSKQQRNSISYEETDELGIPFDGITDEDLILSAFKRLDFSSLSKILLNKSKQFLAVRNTVTLPGKDLTEDDLRASFLLTDALLKSGYRVVTRDPKVLSRIYHEVKPDFTMYLGKIEKKYHKSDDKHRDDEEYWSVSSVDLFEPYVFSTPVQDLTTLAAANYVLTFDVLEMGIRELPEPKKEYHEYYSRTAKVSIFCKLIDPKSAQVIWADQLEATTDPKVTPVIYKHLARGERWFFIPDPATKIEVAASSSVPLSVVQMPTPEVIPTPPVTSPVASPQSILPSVKGLF